MMSIWIAPGLSIEPNRAEESWKAQIPSAVRQHHEVQIAWTPEWQRAERAELSDGELCDFTGKETYQATMLAEPHEDLAGQVQAIFDDAARAYTYIRTLIESAKPRPAAVLLWNNRSMGAMVWRTVCERLGVGVVHVEGGWLPGTRIFDPCGSYLDPVRADWLAGQQGTYQDEKVGRVVTHRWAKCHTSKHEQGSMSLSRFPVLRISRPRTLLVAGQLMLDSSMIFPSCQVTNPLELLELCRKKWIGPILMKRHPISHRVEGHPHLEKVHQQIRELCAASKGRIIYAEENVNIHALFSMCPVVATINSNVGLEAAMAGRYVVAYGEAHYTLPGITGTLKRHPPLSAPSLRNRSAVHRYVGLLTRYLYPEGCWVDGWNADRWWGGEQWEDAGRRLLKMWEGVLA